jgi:hypothetical protein
MEGVSAERSELFGEAFMSALRAAAAEAHLTLAAADGPGAGPVRAQPAQTGRDPSAVAAAARELTVRAEALRRLPLLSLQGAGDALGMTTTVMTTWVLLFAERKTLLDAAAFRKLAPGTLQNHVADGMSNGLLAALQAPDAVPGYTPGTITACGPHQRRYASFDDLAGDVLRRVDAYSPVTSAVAQGLQDKVISLYGRPLPWLPTIAGKAIVQRAPVSPSASESVSCLSDAEVTEALGARGNVNIPAKAVVEVVAANGIFPESSLYNAFKVRVVVLLGANLISPRALGQIFA